MARELAIPTSSGLERDARRMHADDRGVRPGEIALGVVIGRTSEFFDFFVYAIASVLVFPQLVFPFVDRLTGVMLAFALFALAFIARPFGSVIFGAIDRRYGRGVKLTIALFLLGGSTAVISLLPSYAAVGPLAIWALAACRVGQGLALAGAWDGMASLLALNAPENKRGWYAMIPQLGAPFGFMLASGLFAYFVSTLSTADFLDWGWRYPFFAAFAINVVALFARLRIVATEEFGALFENRELRPTRIASLLRAEGGNVLIGAFAPLATFAMFHLVTVFPLSWVVLHGDNQQALTFLRIELFGALVGVVGILASGWIADRITRQNQLALSALLIGAFSLLAPRLLDGGSVGQTAYVVIGFAILGLSFGQAAGAVSSGFSKRYRYTGAALTSDLSWLIGAGFAPLAALGLASLWGLPAIGLYLASGALATLLALTLDRARRRRRAAH
ncbi:MFS transporter [Caulobacter vibrioides]|uniref:MFS transporter n=1 Tax=Caulobacter vibrioides TaxID=155892 RepID=A0A290MQT5_CAUVI|nr:MFS transporter [Caulobacter vibrioides]ATC32191.1 MFS transporter [Caulobacter vibrioides]